MTAARRLTARILLAAGVLVTAGCEETSHSTDDCHPPTVENCLTHDASWRAARGETAGQGGSGATPDRCPTTGDMTSEFEFLTRAGLPGGTVLDSRAEGPRCCYATPSFICEGRPLVVAGALRTARLGGASGWG